jgi:hypothetical protein
MLRTANFFYRFSYRTFSFAGSFVYAEDGLVGKFKILINFSQITGG